MSTQPNRSFFSRFTTSDKLSFWTLFTTLIPGIVALFSYFPKLNDRIEDLENNHKAYQGKLDNISKELEGIKASTDKNAEKTLERLNALEVSVGVVFDRTNVVTPHSNNRR